jgi:hypothetical protein
MKKKLIVLFLLLIVITGCSNNKSIESNNNTKKVDDYIGINYKSKHEIKCEEMKNAKLMSESLFVTTDGKVYHYGFDNLYSNEQNCKKFDDELDTSWSGPVTISDIVGLRNGELIDSKMHQITTSIDTNKMGVRGSYNHRVENIKEWYFSLPGFIIRENDKMYALSEYDNNKQEIKNSLPSSEKIISVNGGVIKTDKGYYLLRANITNKNECEKYDDVECKVEYFIESSDVLNKLDDKIFIAYSRGYSYDISEMNVYAKNNTIYSIEIDK